MNIPSKVSSIEIENMKTEDLLKVHQVQLSVYSKEFHEVYDCFREKFNVYPQGCFVARKTDNDSVVGYCFSHPISFPNIPSLNGSAKAVENPNSYFIHDLALSQDARGLKVGKALYTRVLKVAEDLDFKQIYLISVQQSRKFWEQAGFIEVDNMEEKMISLKMIYGPDACLMQKISK
ncbi:hypothetical protein K7432_008466 [Basidiobolus ranarum]|uniref:N-acetyltransferase domain-containing protein n=1 Tax=Basidiobolus ranarum TaxID=34480 RepID=A0ABR2VYL5_9FUNG